MSYPTFLSNAIYAGHRSCGEELGRRGVPGPAQRSRVAVYDLPAGMLAIRPGDVELPDGVPGEGSGTGSALVVGRGARLALRSGEYAVFCQMVTAAPVHVHRDGRLTAVGRVADHARLGLLEDQLAPGLLDELAAGYAAHPPSRDRVMSLGFTLRCVLMMTLLPSAGYREVMAVVAGQLTALPWRRRWQLPGAEVLARWRTAARPTPVRGTVLAGRRADRRSDPARNEVAGPDGVRHRRVPDPRPGHRRQPGRVRLLGHRRRQRAVPADPRRHRHHLRRPGHARGGRLDASKVGEQTLTTRLADTHPEVFTRDRVFLVDRNYLGFDLIVKILSRGSHLLMRIKAGIKLPVVRWLPDGSYLSYLTAPDGTSALAVRVVEYDVVLPGADGVSELFCLATDLLDHRRPTRQASCGTPTRSGGGWKPASAENNKTITDAGPSRGPILRSTTPDGVRQEFWAWLSAIQLLRKSGTCHGHQSGHHPTTDPAAATGPGDADRPADLTGKIFFTAIRRELIRAVQLSTHTATTSANVALAAAARFGAQLRKVPLQIDRDRHRSRVSKWQPRFPAPKGRTATTTGRLAAVVHAPDAMPTAPSSG